MPDPRIAPLGREHIEALSDLLIETVAGGGSVSFMHPLSPEAARAFWDGALDAAEKGHRIVLGGFVDDILAGTVTLVLDLPPNQPHRGEISKLMTKTAFRKKGVATALMAAAEALAARNARTLLVLDTAEDEGAAPLYARLGYTQAGIIPDFALKPHGGLTGSVFFWKRIGANEKPPAAGHAAGG